MTGLRRNLAPTALALALFAAPAAAQSSDLARLFNEGLALLEQGQEAEALATFQRALALDPSSDEAYELYRSTEQEVWLRLLVREGQFEIVAKRFIDMADLGRIERLDDRDAIRELLTALKDAPTPVERRQIVASLRARHGEYAVPYMLGALAERSEEPYRVLVMLSLAEMGSAAVPPLVEALESTDAFQARNVAITLGNLGDPRAAGSLAWVAADATRPDDVRRAAQQALEKVAPGWTGAAAAQLVAEGDQYLNDDDRVLAPYQFSQVVWNWGGGELAHVAVPAPMYGEEMAKKSFHRALEADQNDLDALAGLVRASVAQNYELGLIALAGGDVAAQSELAAQGLLTAFTSGPAAMERALERALADNDVSAAIAILRTYGRASAAPSPAMLAALGYGVGQVREEAAIAIAHAGLAGGRLDLDGRVVGTLATAAGRAIQRTALVIDGDENRRNAIVADLESRGIACASADRGIVGLANLRKAGGVDVIVCADTLSDITTQQVLTDVRNDARLGATPFVVVSSDVEAAGEMYEDRANAIIGGAGEGDAVVAALDERMNVDRAEADDLSARASAALAALASANVDVTAAADALASTLAQRPDDVVLPATAALARAGAARHADALVALVVDGDRSDEARVAGGRALANLLRRTGGVSASAYEALAGLVVSDASLAVRHAAAEALGALELGGTQRAAALRSVEVQVSE
jgi:CheY-like chemotaxis protein